LFKIKAIGNAEVEVGAGPFTTKLRLRSKERQINEEDFSSVNLNKFYADSDIGFVIRKPLSEEWTIKKLHLREALKERGITQNAVENSLEKLREGIESPNENIRVLVITRGGAQSIRYTEETVVGGQQLNLEILKEIAKLLPSCKEMMHDQLSVYACKKDAMKQKRSLLEFFLGWVSTSEGLGPKSLYVNHENSVFLLDCSAFMGKVEYNGEIGDHIMNNMFLYQENKGYFFCVIVSYVQAADKSTKVWDELRDYLNSFRVLVE